MHLYPEDEIGAENEAFTQVLSEYRPLVESMITRFSDSGEEKEDLRQEAYIALLSAINTYDSRKSGVTFGLYAKVCIRNRLITVLRKKKELPDFLPEETADAYPSDAVGPEQGLIAQERYGALLSLIDKTLTKLEKQVLVLYLEDASYAQIASRLGVTEKTVDNAIYRLKAKLRKHV